jgi:TonB family protein
MSALLSLSLPSWLLDYILNSIWQVPLIFAAAWIAARLARPTGPRMEHRVWVFALIAETLLPAVHLNLTSLGQQLYAALVWAWDWSLGRNPGNGDVRVVIGPGAVSNSGLHLPSVLLATVETAYTCALVYFAVRLAWGLWKTSRMQRQAQPLPVTTELAVKFAHTSIQSKSAHPIHVAISSLVTGPVTLGILRRVLLLPPGFLSRVTEADLDAVLAHELAHIERRDFAKNLLYGFLSLPIAYHPALWLTTARLAESREMVCDETAASSITGRDSYARALLRLASMLTEPMPIRTLHAIGIFDANIFERRIMSLTQKRTPLAPALRIALTASCIVLGLAACASALALRMDVSPSAAQTEAPKKIHVKVDDTKIITRVNPVYPIEAKEARIQGAVVLDVQISKEGVPMNINIQKGPKELQKSAMDAVGQWRWQPFLLNGDPVEVETTVTVVYSLEK